MRVWIERRFLSLASITLVLLSLLGCGKQVMAGGGDSPSSNVQTITNGILVSGIGTASAQPNLAFVDLGVETTDLDAGQAVTQNIERMHAVMNVIKEMGIEEKDVQTVQYSVWIEQVINEEGRPTGERRYHATNQVRIRLRELNRTGELLTEAVKAGANVVSGVSFGVEDATALYREARGRAIADAKAKAEQLAMGLGAKLGPVRQVTESTSGFMPIFWGDGRGGGGEGVPISAGESNVTIQIQVVFDIAE